MDVNKQDINIYSLALKEIKELGLFSFSLEEKRESNLISQAGKMLTAFSILSAALLMVLSALLEYTNIYKEALFAWTGAIFVPLICSLCLSIAAQWRFKYYAMQDPAHHEIVGSHTFRICLSLTISLLIFRNSSRLSIPYRLSLTMNLRCLRRF